MNKSVRKSVIAGNWKMNNTPSQAKALIEDIGDNLQSRAVKK